MMWIKMNMFILPVIIATISVVVMVTSVPIIITTTTEIPTTIDTRTLKDLPWTSYCPCRQCNHDENGDRKIICDSGGIIDIPFDRISPTVEVIEISAPQEKPNNLTLGPLFYQFPRLKKLKITKSNIPAVGSTTFRYKTKLKVLDLSQNRIEHLIDSNFLGLSHLETLNLSHNYLSELASGTFQQLYNLKHLSLAHNRIDSITTRLFYNLTSLETLDLSYNPIGEIPPRNMVDLRPLKYLYLKNCQIRQIHSLFYRNLPNLKVLDLRDNLLERVHQYEFSPLRNLSELYLDRNRLSSIDAYAFLGNQLQIVSISSNRLNQLDVKTFANCSVQQLDLSNNNFTEFPVDVLESFMYSLQELSVDNIPGLTEPATSVSRLLAPLKSLETLRMSYLRLETLPPGIFAHHRQTLRHLNLSHNAFVNISARLIEGLQQLEVLDLSHNYLQELSSEFLFELQKFSNLTAVFFDGNPWSCLRCHVLTFLDWITTPPNPYQTACQKFGRCAVCRNPLNGTRVDLLEDSQLEWCSDPTVQLRVSTTEPNVGLVLALLIIIILVIVILCVIVYYRNRGAIYFTNEELLYGRPSTVTEEDSRPSVYNISHAIRDFVNATSSPPESMSVRSASIDSAYHRHHHPDTHKLNGSLYASVNRRPRSTYPDSKPIPGTLPRASDASIHIQRHGNNNTGSLRSGGRIRKWSHEKEDQPIISVEKSYPRPLLKPQNRSLSNQSGEDIQSNRSGRNKKVILSQPSQESPPRPPRPVSPPPKKPKSLSISSSSRSSHGSGAALTTRKKRQKTPPPSPPSPPPSPASASSTTTESSTAGSASQTETDLSEKLPATLCPYEEVMDSREASPSGSIDDVTPIEVPTTGLRPCPACRSSSTESLPTAALAENDGDSGSGSEDLGSNAAD